jgi:hypothetical protein
MKLFLVIAAALLAVDGCVLIAQRPQGEALVGCGSFRTTGPVLANGRKPPSFANRGNLTAQPAHDWLGPHQYRTS